LTRKITVLALLLILPSFSVAASGQDASEYDPSPFLSSMIALRGAAVTCDPFVGNSPAQRTEAVTEFFSTLKQTLPPLVDTETQASLRRFIGSQAAILCRDKLTAAYEAYDRQLQVYAAKKPEDWPAPPEITNAPWCGSPYCLEF
jgi:hypothetical protein